MNCKQFNKVDSFNKKSDGTEITHEEFYTNIVKAIGLYNLIPLIPEQNKEILKQKYQEDKHLNNIPIRKWDEACGSQKLLDYAVKSYLSPYKAIPFGVTQLLHKIGINSYSLSDCVCILKQAAQIWINQEEKINNKGEIDLELLDLKKQALLNYLQESDYPEATLEDITEGYNESNFEAFGNEYNVFTEEEREEEVTNYIRESVWAFNANFILDNSRIEWSGNREYQAIEKALKEIQEKLCESANPLILALIEDFDQFVENATDADGYGHFLSGYDGEEIEEGKFYIYRQN